MPILSPIGAATSGAFGLPKSASGSAGDPYYEYVTMLLTGDGTNGAQNNTFLDASANAYTITRNGDVTQGSFSPYGSLWSNYFDGSSYLTVSGSSQFEFGTGDFTIEYWVYPTALNCVPVGQTYNASAYAIQPFINSGTGSIELAIGATSNTTSNGAVVLNQWNHVAIVRSGTTLQVLTNGTSKGSWTYSSNAGDNATMGIGARPSGNYKVNGNVSNVRIVKGTALYSGSTYTVPTTPLTAVSGTSLLTCQSNRFVDNSSNAFALTINGTPSVQRFSPFNPTASYDTATIGGSANWLTYGRLQLPSSITIGSNSTLEAWIYPTTYDSYCMLFTGYGDVRNDQFTVGPSGVGLAVSGSVVISSTGTVVLNAWNHVALTWTGSTYALYLNGARLNTGGSSTAFIFKYLGASSGSDYFTYGYVTNWRYSNTLRYSGTTYTVPTAPFTTDANTQLLLSCTNAGIPDSAMMNDLETVGNAQVSTSVKKYGTGSISLDGTDDKLIAPYQPWMNFGTGDFTVEMWINFNTALASLNDNSGIYVYRSASLENTSCNIRTRQTPGIAVQLGATDTNFSWNPSTGTWYHLAIVRSSGTLTMYVNGTSVGSGTNTGNVAYESGYFLTVGGNPSVSTLNINAYIDDLRVSKFARYTSNFTAPTAAFPTY